MSEYVFPPESAKAARNMIALITAYHDKDLLLCETLMGESNPADLMRCLLVFTTSQCEHRAEYLGLSWEMFIQTYGLWVAELTQEEEP